ncbi:MAG: alpha/beta fold hydrolase [Desulfobacter sp.]|nr:alpha/beta fold hydrolase [Desulfobacter sp.]WDP86177.1 MAG: alpha/beta fold hydrolase [Desulfobacter sp.]
MKEVLTIEHQGKKRQIQFEWQGQGDPENPTLVFLHQGLGSLESFKDIPKQLSKACQCNTFTYSRLGYGQSDPISLPRKINYLHVEALRILPKILAAAKIKSHIIVGHSDGGSIGLIYAGSDRAKNLKAMVSLAAHVFCEPITLKGIQKTKERYQKGNLKSKLSRIHGQNTDTAFWGWNQVWLSPGFCHWNIERYLKSIDLPVLAIQGTMDPYGTQAQLKAMNKGIKNCKTWLLDHCYHDPFMEQPKQTLAAITQFLGSILPEQIKTDQIKS